MLGFTQNHMWFYTKARLLLFGRSCLAISKPVRLKESFWAKQLNKTSKVRTKTSHVNVYFTVEKFKHKGKKIIKAYGNTV